MYSLAIVSDTIPISGEIRSNCVELHYQNISFLRIIMRPEGRVLFRYM